MTHVCVPVVRRIAGLQDAVTCALQNFTRAFTHKSFVLNHENRFARPGELGIGGASIALHIYLHDRPPDALKPVA